MIRCRARSRVVKRTLLGLSSLGLRENYINSSTPSTLLLMRKCNSICNASFPHSKTYRLSYHTVVGFLRSHSVSRNSEATLASFMSKCVCLDSFFGISPRKTNAASGACVSIWSISLSKSLVLYLSPCGSFSPSLLDRLSNMKLFLSVVSFVGASFPLGASAKMEKDLRSEFVRAMQGNTPDSFSVSHLLEHNQDGSRRLQCSDYFCEDSLCVSLNCCGADSVTECDCTVYLSGDACRRCYVCSNENVYFDCSDEAYGDCVGMTCSESCIENPRPSPPSPSPPTRPSSPSPPSASPPSSPSQPSRGSSSSSGSNQPDDDEDDGGNGLLIGIIVGLAGLVVTAITVVVYVVMKPASNSFKDKDNHPNVHPQAPHTVTTGRSRSTVSSFTQPGVYHPKPILDPTEEATDSHDPTMERKTGTVFYDL